MLEIFRDPPKWRKLRIELAVLIEAGEPFLKATYHLEGDGPLVFVVYKEITILELSIAVYYFPSVHAIARPHKAGGESSRETQLINYATGCVKPGYEKSLELVKI